MKELLSTLLFFSTLLMSSQEKLQFNKRFVECEDTWVAFAADSTGTHHFGFIYIDSQAGLTLDLEGSFKLDDTEKVLYEKKEKNSSMKYRLQPNNTLVAVIPERFYTDLEIQKTPDWLQFYKNSEGSIEQLYRWGFLYNGYGECKKALEFLEKAEKIDPNFKGLQVELAYSYNCLKQYQKAVDKLKFALKANPTDAYSNKELIYAQTKIDQADSAEKVYHKVLKESTDQQYNVENAYNILQAYYMKKDIKNFNRWLRETETLLGGNERFQSSVNQMKSDLKQ